MTQPQSSITKEWKYHFISLVLIALITGFIYPFKTNVDLWRPYFIRTIYYTWLVYSLLAGFQLMPILRKGFKNTSKLSSIEIWLISIYFGNLTVWFAYNYSRFTSYIVGALTFTFLFYLVILFLFFNKQKRSVIFNKNTKYGDKKIDDKIALQLIDKLKILMLEEKIYANANLKSSQVAKKISITTHQFSQLLNDNLKKNFALFINEYRIEAAKELLLKNDNFTLEAVAYECGFNSKSTFYNYFKKIEGKTPAQYRSSNL